MIRQMMLSSRAAATLCAALIGLQVCAAGHTAERHARSEDPYPVRPIRLILGLPPGGSVDIVARIVMPSLGAALGQPIVIDNRPGGSGVIGAELAVRAPADGHTLMFRGSFVSELVHAAHGKLAYDPLRDLAPVSLVTRTANVLVVHPSLPAQDVAQFVSYAKAYPGKLNYGSSGPGSSAHVAMELLKQITGTDLVHVPYRGAPQFAAALLSGEIAAAFANVPGQLANVKSGKLRALAVTSAKRNFQLPDLPTMHEAGIPGFELTVWTGVLAPRHVRESVLSRLNAELVKVLRAPDVAHAIRMQGAEPAPMSRAEFAAFQQADAARLNPVIRKADIRP